MGLAAVLFFVVVGAKYYWEMRSHAAAEAFYSANTLKSGSDEHVAALVELIDNYPRTPAGRQGMMELGNIYMAREEYPSAVEQFKKLVGKSRNQPMIYIAALHMMAEAELAGGDAKAAAEIYLKAAADPHNLISQTSRLRAAVCMEKAKEYAQAALLYRQIIDESTEMDSVPKARSEERLIWLAANGYLQQ